MRILISRFELEKGEKGKKKKKKKKKKRKICNFYWRDFSKVIFPQRSIT